MSTKKNIIVWNRAVGLGDMFQILAAGMVHFGKSSFEIIATHVEKIIETESPHYLGYYYEIAKCFTLCEKLTIKKLRNEREILDFVKNINHRKNNVLYIPDSGIEKQGRYICYKNTENILSHFKKYFNPKVKDSIKRLFQTDKINICFLLTGDFKDPLRKFDLKEWEKFITWVAGMPDFNIILIYDDNCRSRCYIPREKIKKLFTLKRISRVKIKEDPTSISNVIFCLLNCNLFCSSLGGFSHFTMTLGKPMVIFYDGVNFAQYDSTYDTPLLWAMNTFIQRIYYFSQNYENMKNLFKKYLNSVFFKYGDTPIKEIFFMQKNAFKEDWKKVISESKQLRTSYGLERWYFYNQGYFELGYFCIKNDIAELAIELFKKSDGYIPIDGTRLYEVGRYFKDKGYYEEAKIFLGAGKLWASYQNIKRKDIVVASNFHLGEIFYFEKSYEKALDYFKTCLKFCLEHEKAKEYVLDILKVKKQSIVVWGMGGRYDKYVKPLEKKLNIIGFVDNNSRMWGERQKGLEIFPPQRLLDLKPQILMVCSFCHELINEQLKAMNLDFDLEVVNL